MMRFRPLVLALVASFCWQVSTATAGDKPILQWEYRVVSKDQITEMGKTDLATGLNKLGAEGWELVVVDGGYIFKRAKPQNDREVAELRLKIAMLQRDCDQQKERVAWSERMLKLGYMSPAAVDAERVQLERYQLILDKNRKELESLTPPPNEPIKIAPTPKEMKPEK